MQSKKDSYWNENIRILIFLLSIWFLVSFGFGILLSDWLDQFQIGGFKLGFWFAQQGSIYVFIILIFIYIHLMNKLDNLKSTLLLGPGPSTVSPNVYKALSTHTIGHLDPRFIEIMDEIKVLLR